MTKTTCWDRYLGIPYEHGETSFDSVYCWGLVRLVYREELRIELSDYWYKENWYKPNQSDGERFLRIVGDEGFKKIDQNKIKEYDLIMMRIKSRKVNHCGLITGGDYGKKILHAHDSANSCRVPMNRLERFSHSFWRHEAVE